MCLQVGIKVWVGILRRVRPIGLPPYPRPSRHPPSAGPWQLKKERGGRPESAFEGLQATSSPAVLTPQGIPDFPICGQSGPRFLFPGRIGKRPVSRFPIPGRRSGIGNSLPVSRPNRESGERESGISGSARRPRRPNRDCRSRRLDVPRPTGTARELEWPRRASEKQRWSDTSATVELG